MVTILQVRGGTWEAELKHNREEAGETYKLSLKLPSSVLKFILMGLTIRPAVL